MILKSVKIKNFRTFRDANIDFGYSGDEKITILRGNTGVGKTTILNAISWCLYGYEIYSSPSNHNRPICNYKTVNIANPGDKIEVKVELEFLDNEETLRINRAWGFVKSEDGLIREHSLDNFELTIEKGNEFRLCEHPDAIIERNFPQDVLFLNPHLFAEFRMNGLEVKELILSLSQVNLIEKAYKHISNMEIKYIRKQKEIHPDVATLNEKISELEKRIKESKEKLEMTQNQINEINDQINEIDDELDDDINAIYSLMRRNIELENKILGINKQLKKLEIKLEDYILLKYPYIMSYNSFLEFVDLIDSYLKSNHVPREVTIFIRNLLDEGKCVCGTDFSLDNDYRKILEDFLKNNVDAPNHKGLEEILFNIKYIIIDDIRKFKSTALEIHKELKELKEHRQGYMDEKMNLELRLRGCHGYIERREHLISLKTNLSKKISNLESSIKEDEDTLYHHKLLFDEKYEEISDSDEYQKKIDFCRESSTVAKDMYENFSENIREKVQDLVKENFLKISFMPEYFIDIRIDENYEIFIKNNSGFEINTKYLAGCETLIIGLCYMEAIYHLTCLDLPIIMEFPGTILDRDMGLNFAEFLIHSFEDKQIILLFLNRGLTDEVRDILQSAIAKEFEIIYNSCDEGDESEVILNG